MKFYVSKSGRIHEEGWFKGMHTSGMTKPTKCGKDPFDFWEEVPIERHPEKQEKSTKQQLVEYAEEHELDFCKTCFPYHPEAAKVHLQLTDEQAEVLQTSLSDEEDEELRLKIKRARGRRAWKVEEYGRWES